MGYKTFNSLLSMGNFVPLGMGPDAGGRVEIASLVNVLEFSKIVNLFFKFTRFNKIGSYLYFP